MGSTIMHLIDKLKTAYGMLIYKFYYEPYEKK